MTKLFIELERLLYGRRFRLFMSLLAIGQGLVRLEIANATSQTLAFGTNSFYGIASVILGALLLISAFGNLRTGWSGRTVAVLLSAIYGMIGVAAIPVSTSSSYAAIIMAIFLLMEATVIYER